MNEPIDLLTGAQDAVVKLLREHLPSDQRQLVRHSLKQGTEPPFHLVGDIDTENAGSKDEQAEDITVDVHTIYRGTDRRVLLGMMHQVRIAVDDASIAIGGGSFRCAWLTSAASTAASDGVTYAGITTLSFFAEPA